MKHTFETLIVMALMAITPLCAQAQKYDVGIDNRYRKADQELGAPKKGERRVVFLGNSITDNWFRFHPEFFTDNGYIGRGQSGQTSFAFLLRLREDVIKLQPKVLVLNYGTNDVAENNGPYDEELTFGNVQSIVELARAHKIKVILTSCLPARQFGWRKSITGAMDKIRRLNARVKAYAEANKIPYVDYFSSMVSSDGTQMNTDYSKDGVHPNLKGYAVMEALIKPVVEKYRR